MMEVRIEAYKCTYHYDDVLTLDTACNKDFVKIERRYGITVFISKREVIDIYVQQEVEHD